MLTYADVCRNLERLRLCAHFWLAAPAPPHTHAPLSVFNTERDEGGGAGAAGRRTYADVC
jgi:hypothetical protein